jgi:hypothetical protein
MARDAELRARITAQDDASKVIDKIADKADDLEKKTVKIPVDVDAKEAIDDLDKVADKAGQVDGATARVEATADTGDAEASLETVAGDVDDLDGANAEVEATADADDAIDSLEEVAGDVEDLDGTTAEVEVTADTAEAESSIGGLGDLIAEAGERGFGQFSGAAASAFDAVTAGGAAMGVGLFAGLAAGIGKAITDFQNVALGAGELRDALGVTADEASRLQEVAGDLGIGVGPLESALARMNTTAGKTPGKFKEIGAAIALGPGGTTDVTATFLNVIGALNAIPDAADRAAAGAKIFGKGWTNMAELVDLGAQGVTDALASVESGKLVLDPQIAEARELRDSLDELKGQFESLELEVGKGSLPLLKALATGFTALSKGLPGGEDQSMFNAFGSKESRDNMEKTVAAAHGAISAVVDWESINAHAAESTAALAQGTADAAAAQRDHTAAVQAAQGVTSGFNRTLEEERDLTQGIVDALHAQADALNAQVAAATSAADQQLLVNDAFAHFGEMLGDNKASANDVRDAAIDLAKATGELKDKQAEANGETLTATERLDNQNAALLNTAGAAKGPARDGILEYIGAVNQIPPEKMTEIKAALARGDVDEAKRLLDEASATRTAAIKADADTAAADAELNRLTRDRHVRVIGSMTFEGPREMGGTVPRSKGLPGIAGEAGPEFIRLPDGRQMLLTGETVIPPGTQVTSVRRTRQILSRRGLPRYANGTGGVTVTAPTVALPPIKIMLDGRPIAALIGTTTAPAVRAAAMAIRAGRA